MINVSVFCYKWYDFMMITAPLPVYLRKSRKPMTKTTLVWDADNNARRGSSSSSSSYIVQTPSGVYSYWRSAVQELSTVDLKTCVCTVQLKTSSTFYLMTTGWTSLLKLSMVGQLTTDWGRLFQSQMVSGKKDLW